MKTVKGQVRWAEQEETVRDVIVVGGGAAGLSAALVLARSRRRVTVVDADRAVARLTNAETVQ